MDNSEYIDRPAGRKSARLAWWLAMATAAVSGGLRAGDVPLTEDPPLARTPRKGEVHGTLSAGEPITRVWAVCRATRTEHAVDEWDGDTGRFRFKGLPGGAAYDVCFQTQSGRVAQGIDLSFVDSRMLRLSAERRKQLGLAPEPSHDFSQADANELIRYVHDIKDFMDHKRALYVAGHGERATVLIESLRNRAFYAREGKEVIWRIELWYFVYRYGGWEQLQDTNRVLERRRIPHSQWKKISLEYFPALSVRMTDSGHAPPVDFRLGEMDPSRGRVPSGSEKLTSEPHVSGLDETADQAATRPAGQ